MRWYGGPSDRFDYSKGCMASFVSDDQVDQFEKRLVAYWNRRPTTYRDEDGADPGSHQG